MTQPPAPDSQTQALPPPADDASLPAGLTVAGRFRIIRFIARGGMGDVYEAEDTQLHEHVALKTVRPDIAADPKNVERFKREIALARKVTHPNVCRIYDLFEDSAAQPGGTPRYFLTMEMLEGETLTQAIKRRGHYTPAEALPLVKQMAHALHTAHRAGVVHRDFKSPNVILVADPGSAGGVRAVVCDFGLAHATGLVATGAEISTIGSFMGSPAYMAPEQVEGKDVGPAADIYAFGAVLYEMMTGRFPFTGGNPMAIAVKRLHEAPPSPLMHVPDLDPHWEAAIMRCLERYPNDRFQNLSEVVRALSEPAVPRPAQAPAPSMPPPLPTAAPHAAIPSGPPGAGLRIKDTAGATICPQCERLLPGYSQCPICKVPTVIRRDDVGDDYKLSILARLKREKRNKALKKLIVPGILLLIFAGVATAVCWPVQVPVMTATGETSLQMLKLNWDDFQDKIKFNQPAHFEITDTQLTTLLRAQPGFEKAAMKFTGAAATVYLPHQKLPATLVVTFTPLFAEKSGMLLRVDRAQFGQLPLPRKAVEDKVAEFSGQLRTLLKGVTGVTIAGSKLKLDSVPKLKEMPNGAVNWQVIR